MLIDVKYKMYLTCIKKGWQSSSSAFDLGLLQPTEVFELQKIVQKHSGRQERVPLPVDGTTMGL